MYSEMEVAFMKPCGSNYGAKEAMRRRRQKEKCSKILQEQLGRWCRVHLVESEDTWGTPGISQLHKDTP